MYSTLALALLLACHPDSPDAQAPTTGEPGAPTGTDPTGATTATGPVAAPDFVNAPMASVPLLGGTLEAAPDLGLLVGADPAANQVFLLDPVVGGPPRFVDLGDNARPFRLLVEGSEAWVTLRGTGELASLDLVSGAVNWRSRVCPEPRGVARSSSGELVVACAGGELVALTVTGALTRVAHLGVDLRDVVAADDTLYVSTFRSPSVLFVNPATLALERTTRVGFSGTAAYRMRARQDGGVLVIYQESSEDEISTTSDTGSAPSGSAYGSSDVNSCSAVVSPAFATVDADGAAAPGPKIFGATGVVDFVFQSPDLIAMVSGGAAPNGIAVLDPISSGMGLGCASGTGSVLGSGTGQPAAVAVLDNITYLQTAGASGVYALRRHGVLDPVWESGATLAEDDPFALFTRDTGTGISCMGCHPEGQEDGHTWRFAADVDGVEVAGPRRTMTLAGNPSARGPYHWLGEFETADQLLASTMTARMGGPALAPETVSALMAFLDGLRPEHADPNATAAQLVRGEALFASAGCVTCHSGSLYTDNQRHAVVGDLAFKTPSLVGVGLRAALMHDGCAPDLEARLTGDPACTGGDAHGTTSTLSADDVAALAAWMRTL